MIRYLKNRLARFVDDCIKQRIDTIAAVAGSRVDLDKIAVRVPFDRGQMVDEILDRLKTGHTVEYDRLAECIDIEELAKQFDLTDIAGELDYANLANHLDTSDIARDMEVEASEVAEHVEVDADEVAEHLDYRRLAAALLEAVRAGT